MKINEFNDKLEEGVLSGLRAAGGTIHRAGSSALNAIKNNGSGTQGAIQRSLTTGQKSSYNDINKQKKIDMYEKQLKNLVNKFYQASFAKNTTALIKTEQQYNQVLDEYKRFLNSNKTETNREVSIPEQLTINILKNELLSEILQNHSTDLDVFIKMSEIMKNHNPGNRDQLQQLHDEYAKLGVSDSATKNEKPTDKEVEEPSNNEIEEPADKEVEEPADKEVEEPADTDTDIPGVTGETIKKDDLQKVLNVLEMPARREMIALLKDYNIQIESKHINEDMSQFINKIKNIAKEKSNYVLASLGKIIPAIKQQTSVKEKEVEAKSSKPRAYAKLLYSVLVKSNKDKREKYIERLNRVLFKNTLKSNGKIIEFEDLLKIIKYISDPTAPITASESIDFLLYDSLERKNIFKQAVKLGKEMFYI